MFCEDVENKLNANDCFVMKNLEKFTLPKVINLDLNYNKELTAAKV